MPFSFGGHVDTQTLADLIVGMSGVKATKQLIAKIKETIPLCPPDFNGQVDDKLEQVIRYLEQGYLNWYGVKFPNNP